MVLGIFGAGGFGREVLECVKQIQMKEKKWSEVIFIDDYTEALEVNGVPVLKYNDYKKKYKTEQAGIFIAVGEPAAREKLYNMVKSDGFCLETIIHPNVWVPETTEIGDGSYIAYEAFVSCNITIGNNTLIMPCASIGHDTVIGNHCVLSGQCNIAGNCKISDYCFLGLNSIVKEKISLAEWTIVSVGSAVLKDVLEPEYILSGIPARKMQKNDKHKVF